MALSFNPFLMVIYFRHHLALPTEAETHYRAVCRALVSNDNEDYNDDDEEADENNDDDDDDDDIDYKQVSEALELSSFMEKISSSRLNETIDGEVQLRHNHHHHHH